MDADRIAEGLVNAKQTRPGQWIACCPAHNDKNPSLSITQTRDKVLVHCFAGCEQSEVVQVLTDLGYGIGQHAIDDLRHPRITAGRKSILWLNAVL